MLFVAIKSITILFVISVVCRSVIFTGILQPPYNCKDLYTEINTKCLNILGLQQEACDELYIFIIVNQKDANHYCKRVTTNEKLTQECINIYRNVDCLPDYCDGNYIWCKTQKIRDIFTTCLTVGLFLIFVYVFNRIWWR